MFLHVKIGEVGKKTKTDSHYYRSKPRGKQMIEYFFFYFPCRSHYNNKKQKRLRSKVLGTDGGDNRVHCAPRE